MNDREFSAVCARINSSLDVKEFIRLLGYYPEKAIRAGGLWRLFCPIHGDTLFRTLVVNPRRNTYHCEYSLCSIHQPGDLVDLLTKVRGCTREEAVAELYERFGADQLRLSATQDANLRDLTELLRQAPAEQ
ncbi:MAG: zinc finger protein [Candidatus Sumerlaeota bacterium]|nr:zinc finger protein [Candidatus Sumerlaeota bacterium]